MLSRAMWPLLLAVCTAHPLELRVAKALGSKGYGKARISLVANSTEDAADFHFDYRQPFQYRWTQHALLSSVVELQPGENLFQIAGQAVKIDLPPEDHGIRGVFWADPCVSSRYVVCAFAKTFQTLDRSTKMLNAAFEDPSMDVFGLLGDNFYDQGGELTHDFFSRISLDVKRRFWLVVNGNHDNWVCGFPICGSSMDDFGIGQMQYYPMDSIAAKDDDRVFSFDIDPDQHRQWNRFLNNASNFIFYHKLGNVGFLGYTGAADFSETLPHLQAACSYFEQTQPQVIFLLGHWNNEGFGCSEHMAVPDIHAALLQIPGCASFGRRLKYMDGHEHCNYVQAKDGENYGFMLGGHGMADTMCRPQYGFVYLDTTDRIRLYYFEVGSGGIWGIVVGIAVFTPIAAVWGSFLGWMLARICCHRRKRLAKLSGGGLGSALGALAGFLLGLYYLNPLFPPQDHFQKILSCVEAGGLHACTHLATVWLDEPLKHSAELFGSFPQRRVGHR